MSKFKHYQQQKQNRELNRATKQFIESSPPLRLSKHLRRILLDYMISQKDCLPVDFEIYLADLSNLFDFLDCISETPVL